MINRFGHHTLESLQAVIGGYKVLHKRKVMGSAFVASLDGENLSRFREFYYKKGYPHVEPDSFLQTFLRMYCGSIIHRVNLIKSQEGYRDGSLSSFPSKEGYMEHFFANPDRNDEGEIIPKPVLVMSQDMKTKDLENIPFFKCQDFQKFLTKNKNLEVATQTEVGQKFLNEFTKNNHLEIINDEIKDVKGAIDFLLNKRNFESVYVERGVDPMKTYFENNDTEVPYDLFFLSVFKGHVERTKLGDRFPSLSKLLEKYRLLHISPGFQIDNGIVNVFLFRKKIHKDEKQSNIKELQKV